VRLRILVSAIPVVIALFLQVPSPPNNGVHQTYANNGKKSGASNTQYRNPAVPDISNGEYGSESTYYQYQTEQGPKRGLATPEWVTAFATIIYAIAAIFTLWAIRKQGAETKKAADAAVLSAETSKRSLNVLESADVLLRADLIVGNRPETWIHNLSYLVVAANNSGRSRADKFSFSGKLIPYSKGEVVPGRETFVSATETFTVVAAGDQVEIAYYKMLDWPWLTREVIEDIGLGKSGFVLEFSFRFKDVFDNWHFGEGTARYRNLPGYATFVLNQQVMMEEPKAGVGPHP
jgi:hypothetical protein